MGKVRVALFPVVALLVAHDVSGGDGPDVVPTPAQIVEDARELGIGAAMAEELIQEVSSAATALQDAKAIATGWWNAAPLEHLGLQHDGLRNGAGNDYRSTLQHWKRAQRAITMHYFARLEEMSDVEADALRSLEVRHWTTRLLGQHGLAEIIPRAFTAIPPGAHAEAVSIVLELKKMGADTTGTIVHSFESTVLDALRLLDTEVMDFWHEQEMRERPRIHQMLQSGDATEAKIRQYVKDYIEPFQRLDSIHDAGRQALVKAAESLADPEYRLLKLRWLTPAMVFSSDHERSDFAVRELSDKAWAKLEEIDRAFERAATADVYAACVRNMLTERKFETSTYVEDFTSIGRLIDELVEIVAADRSRP